MAWQLAIVDFDGTLAESMPYWLELPFVTLRQENIPEPEGFRDHIRSLPLWEVGAQLERDYPFLLEKGPVTEQWYRHMEENYRSRVTLRSGAAELLGLLRRAGLKVVLLSATRASTLAIAMERFGLCELLDGVYSEEQLGSKRSEEPYRRLAEETGIPLSDMVLVEDSWKNLQAAKALGMGTVAIQDPVMAKWEEQLRTADVYLRDFQDLSPVEAFLRREEGERGIMQKKLAAYVAAAPENRVQADRALSPELVGQRLYDEPLLAVGDAADPRFRELRAPEAVGDWFRTPEQWLPGAKRVISFFLPFSEEVKRSNFAGSDPSALWLHGRIEGQGFLLQVCRQLQQLLEAQGHTAVIPALDPAFRAAEKPKAPGAAAFTSSWSERHVAWVCGLGTFGLSRGLITEKGMAGRFGSLVTTAELPVTERAYTGIYDYCTGCGACIRRCPVDAITPEGKSHEPCADFLNDTKVRFAPRYGCGKCQVNVPCMSGIPRKREDR